MDLVTEGAKVTPRSNELARNDNAKVARNRMSRNRTRLAGAETSLASFSVLARAIARGPV